MHRARAELSNLWADMRASVVAWIDDYAPSMGAALAYYTVFSIAPLLLIIIAVAGAVFGEDAVRGQILVQLQNLMGPEGAGAVEALLKGANHPTKGFVVSIVSVVLLRRWRDDCPGRAPKCARPDLESARREDRRRGVERAPRARALAGDDPGAGLHAAGVPHRRRSAWPLSAPGGGRFSGSGSSCCRSSTSQSPCCFRPSCSP